MKAAIKVLKAFYRLVRDSSIYCLQAILSVVPRKKGLIVLTSWFGERYADNTRYLYEYLLGYNNVVWVTKNRGVYKQLKEKRFPVVYERSIKGKWTVLRADCLLSTVQLSDYDSRLLTKTVLIDLDHGIPFKQAGYAIVSSDNAYLKKHDARITKHIRYYLTATSYPCAVMLSRIYNVPMEHIILCGKPRDDVFFEGDLLTVNKQFEQLIDGRKVVTYMPTHRNCGREALNVDQHLDLDYINYLCKVNGWLFLIKKHFYHKNETTDLSLFENIIDITDFDLDSQYLLFKTDILVTDYSSVCPEFLLLDRPVILYPYDLEHYLEYDRNLFFPMEEISFVDKPKTIDELNQSLKNLISGVDPYKQSRQKFKKLFFDESITNNGARKEIKKLIDDILSDPDYEFNWETYKNKYKDADLISLMNHIEKVTV